MMGRLKGGSLMDFVEFFADFGRLALLFAPVWLGEWSARRGSNSNSASTLVVRREGNLVAGVESIGLA